jgi:hypothetical protein
MADASGEVKPVDDTATAILRPKKSCVPIAIAGVCRAGC